jgi:hypothetical protein
MKSWELVASRAFARACDVWGYRLVVWRKWRSSPKKIVSCIYVAVNSFNYKDYNCEEMLQETEQRRLSAVKSMQNIIDSIIYAMYTRENVEYCWGSWFGSYSEYSLYSIFTNALKQARRIQKDDCDVIYDEDGCNDDDDGWDRASGASNCSISGS